MRRSIASNRWPCTFHSATNSAIPVPATVSPVPTTVSIVASIVLPSEPVPETAGASPPGRPE